MQSTTDPTALAPGCRSSLQRPWPSTRRRERKIVHFITTVVFARHYATYCCGNLCSANNPYAIVKRKARLALGRGRVAVSDQKKRKPTNNLSLRGETDETSSDCNHSDRRGSCHAVVRSVWPSQPPEQR